MPRINSDVLLMLRAEDRGFIAGLQRANRALHELQTALGEVARERGADSLRITDEYAQGLTRTIRETIPVLKQLFATISDQRKISGAAEAYKNMAASYGEVAKSADRAARNIRKQLEQQEEHLKRLRLARLELATYNRMRTGLLMERRSLQGRTDDDALRRIQQINQTLNAMAASPARERLRATAEEMRPVARAVRELRMQLYEVEQQYSRNAAVARTFWKTGVAADKGLVAAQNELATVNLLNRLERQRIQAQDERITKAKIALDVAKQQQRETIKTAIAQETYNRALRNFMGATTMQKAGVFLQTLAVTLKQATGSYGVLTSAASLFARQQNVVGTTTAGVSKKMTGFVGALYQMGTALRGNNQHVMALSNGLAKLATSIGMFVAAGTAAVRATGLLISMLTRLSSAMFRVGAFAAQSMYNGIKLIIGMSGRFVSSMGNMLRALAGKTAALLRAARASREYARDTMAVSDATGWHSKSLKGLVGNVVNLNRWINTLGSSIRQIGQAFQNAGTMFSIFLSYPVSRTLSGWFNTALEFDKALIEVRKNADLFIDSTEQNVYTLQNLKNELLDLAQRTPTSLSDLGKIAIDTARLGLPPNLIAPFVEIMDQFVVATNVTAYDATKSVGRIMNIFYDLSSQGMQDVESFKKAVLGLTSAINELGQSNPVGENEIVAALLRMAPAAATIGMDLPTAIGLAASVASASATAERAGTQLNNALTQMVAKLKKVASAAGVTEDIFADIINQNPGEAFMGIVYAIAQIPDAVQRAKVANELFGLVGAKATNTLGAAFEKVIENVALSRVAFENATSIVLEFERAMDAVSNQIGLFKNQLSVIGVAIGDAVLPVITQILAYAVPVFQALARLFQQLDDKTKLWIVGIGMLITVLGPLMFAFGSLLFSVGILTTGLTGLLNVFGNILKLPLKLFGALMLLVSPFGLIKTAVIGAILYLLFFGNTIASLGDMIGQIASNMYAWGYNMFISFANGIAAAAETVVQVVYDTLSAIAAVLRSYSPPREGPLHNIDKWGTNIATTFADAFALADLSGVTAFGMKINATLEKTIRGLDVIALDIFQSLWGTISSVVDLIEKDEKKALAAFVNLLSVLQSGVGDVNAAFGALGEQLGAFATDIAEIIKLQVLYNIEVEKTKDLKRQIEKIDERTQEQIRDIAADESLSVSVRLARIRAVKASAIEERRYLESQLELSEQQQEMLKEMIEAQKQYVEIFKEFFKEKPGSARRPGSDKITNDKEKVDELQGKLDKFDVEEIKEKIKGATDSISESLKKTLEDGGRFVQRMNEARVATIAFIDALLGKPINQEELSAYGQVYEDAYNKGKAWRDGIIQWVKDLEKTTQPLRDFLDTVRLLLLVFSTGYTGKDIDEALSKDDSQKARNVLGEYLVVVQNLGEAFKTLLDKTREYFGYLSKLFSGEEGGVLGKIIQSLIELGIAFVKAFSEDNAGIANLKNIIAPVKSVVDSLVILAGLVFDNLDILGEFLGTAAKYIVVIAGYIGVVLEFFKLLAGFGDKENLKRNIELTGNEWLKNLFNVDQSDEKNFVQQLVDMVTGWIEKADFSKVGEALGKKIQESLFGTKNLETGEFSGGLFGNLSGVLDTEGARQFLNNLVAAFAGLVSSLDLQPLVDALAWLLDALLGALANSDAINKLGTSLGNLINQVVNAIPFESITAALIVLANGLITGMKSIVEGGKVQIALKDFVNSLIVAMGNINWDEIASTLSEFVKSLLDELTNVEWQALGGALGNFISALVGALTNVLGDTSTYKNIGYVMGSLAGAIVKGLTSVDWGQLFTPSSLSGFVKAFIDGITEGFKQASKPEYLIRAEEREKQTLEPEQQKELDDLQKRFDSLKNAAQTLPGIARPFVDEMETVYNSMVKLGADPERLGAAKQALEETQDVVNKHWQSAEQIYQDTSELAKNVASKLEEGGEKLKDALDKFLNFIFEPFIPKSAKAQGKQDGNNDDFSIYGPQVQAAGEKPLNNIITALEKIVEDIQRWIEDNQATLGELGGQVMDKILYGLQEFVKESAAQYFVALPVRFGEWVKENIVPLQLLGDMFGMHILTGLSIYFRDNAAGAYSTLLFQFTLWLDANFTILQNYGKDVANRVREGISQRLGENHEYYNNIAHMLSQYVAGIDRKHSISRSGEKIGEKIVDAISRGIRNEWKDIAKSIESAVQRAINAVQITTGDDDGVVRRSSSDDDTIRVRKTSSKTLIHKKTDDKIVGIASIQLPYIPDNREMQNTENITINIHIDNIVADSPKKANEIAEIVSREIARRAKLAYGVR